MCGLHVCTGVSLPVIVHCWLWVGWQFEAAHLFLLFIIAVVIWWEEGLISQRKVNTLLDYETGIGASVNLGNSHNLYRNEILKCLKPLRKGSWKRDAGRDASTN